MKQILNKGIFKSLYLRFFASFLAILIFPLLIIILYFTPTMLGLMEDNMKHSVYNETLQTKNNMDIHLKTIYSIPVQIFQNANLRPYAIGKSVVNKMEAIKELKKVYAQDALIENIYFYLNEEDKIFSQTGMFTIEDYGTSAFNYKYLNRSKKEFKDMITADGKMVCYAAEPVSYKNMEPQNRITLTSSLAVKSNRPYGNVVIMVNEAAVFKLIPVSGMQNNGNCIIFDNEGKKIASSSEISKEHEKLIELIRSEQLEEKIGIYDVNNIKYIVCYITSNMNNWGYINVVPMDSIISEIEIVKTNSMVLILAIIMIELVLIIFFVNINYNPINKLTRLVVPDKKINKKYVLDELDLLKNAIQSLSDKEDNINENMKSAIPAIREHLLRSVINHKIMTVQDFNKLGEDIGLKFRHELFAVGMIFIMQKREAGINNLTIREVIGDIHNEELDGYFIHNYLNFTSMFVCSFDKEETMYHNLSLLCRDLQKKLSCRTIGGLGESVNNIIDLDISYMQACATLEFMEINQENHIKRYRDLINNNIQIKNFPANNLNHLNLALIKMNMSVINKELEYFCNIIGSYNTPMYMLRSIYINVIQLLMSKIIKSSNLEEREKGLHKLDSYLSVDLYDASILIKNIEQCKSLLEKEYRRKEEIRSEAIGLEEILKFMDEHYCEYNFSAQMVAEYANMTLSNFSHYFKKKTGDTFMNFIDTMKLERACFLLKETDDTVEMIAQKLGYSTAGSFIRVFKKQFLETPGEYRKK